MAENQHCEADEDIVGVAVEVVWWCIVMVVLEKVLPMKEHNQIVLVSFLVFYNVHPKTYWQAKMLVPSGRWCRVPADRRSGHRARPKEPANLGADDPAARPLETLRRRARGDDEG